MKLTMRSEKLLCPIGCFHYTKSVQIRSFLWSVFSCIRTKYGDLLSVFSLNTRKYGPEKNSIFGYFLRSVLLKSPTADKGLETHQTFGTTYSKIKQVKFVEDSL